MTIFSKSYTINLKYTLKLQVFIEVSVKFVKTLLQYVDVSKFLALINN